jgi:uncharacterized protein with ParB-like and HNH nuclease domain
MSYTGISIREVVSKINKDSDGWYLPTIQRPYVWGDRHESEKYICKLFDSIFKGYPIGNIIVWNCVTKVPYKDFSTNYSYEDVGKNTDESLWSRKDKWLVYDGQQRLQTLFSCLRYSINGRILVFNLLKKDDSDDIDVVGFDFVDKNSEEPLPRGYIKMSELYSKTMDEKTEYRKSILSRLSKTECTEEDEILIEKRLDKLFNIFVNKDTKVLAYYPLSEEFTEDQVNEVFQRINSGGVPLSGADLLFSRIKQHYYSFEEDALNLAKTIRTLTAGYEVSHYFILLILNVIIKGTTRIDATKVKSAEIKDFKSNFDILSKVVKDFFHEFIFNTFKINNSSLVIRGNALIPIIIYAFHKKHRYGIDFKDIEHMNLLNMHKYFILSQFKDWNTQTILTKNSELAINENFQLDRMIEVAQGNNRSSDINVTDLEYYRKFSLKVILRDRLFINTSTEGRYNPEIDHIYPMKIEDRPVGYDVDVLWNLQPIDGTTNLDKSNKNPNDYFREKPNAKNKYDFIEGIELDWLDFIKKRKTFMLNQFEKDFGINVSNKNFGEIKDVEDNLIEMKKINNELDALPLEYTGKSSIDIQLKDSKNVIFLWKLDDLIKCGIWMNRSKEKIEQFKDDICKIDKINWFSEYKSAVTINYRFQDQTSYLIASNQAIKTVKLLYQLVNNRI